MDDLKALVAVAGEMTARIGPIALVLMMITMSFVAIPAWSQGGAMGPGGAAGGPAASDPSPVSEGGSGTTSPPPVATSPTPAGPRDPTPPVPPTRRPPESGGLIFWPNRSIVPFVENLGQTDPAVRFEANAQGVTSFFTDQGVVMVLASSTGDPANDDQARADPPNATPLSASVVRMTLAGANANAPPSGADMLAEKTNFFHGSDPAKWVKDVPSFGRIVYEDRYPGVSLVFRGAEGGRIEHDFLVAPGGDPSVIRWSFDGAAPKLTASGDLVLTPAGGIITFAAPHIYQIIAGEETTISGGFLVDSAGLVGYSVGPYDHSIQLVIDPILTWSSYLGGANLDHIHDMALDSTGTPYYAGVTYSSKFPTTTGTVQATFADTTLDSDAFVAKYSSAGARLWTTYLGGQTRDSANAISVVGDNVFIAGQTRSAGTFPNTDPSRSFGGGTDDGFAARISTNGNSLGYALYVGGASDEIATGLAVDPNGNAYVVGWTLSGGPSWNNVAISPSTPKDVGQDAFAARFSLAGQLTAFTFVGSSGTDTGARAVLDAAGTLFMSGFTTSAALPGGGNHFTNGGQDAFVTRLSGSLVVLWSTFVGGSGNEYADGITQDNAGNVFITGGTPSGNFAMTPGGQTILSGPSDAFVTKLRASDGAILASTLLGGSGVEFGMKVKAQNGKIFVGGPSGSPDFPVTSGAIRASNPSGSSTSRDLFLTILPDTLDAPAIWSTLLGGAADDFEISLAPDASCNLYLGGSVDSADLPISPPGSSTIAGLTDAFVMKLTNPGDWCSCPGGLPAKEFYNETGSQAKARFLLVPAGDAPRDTNETIAAIPVPEKEAGSPDWYSRSGHLADRATVEGTNQGSPAGSASPGGQRSPMGSDTWANTFLDPPIPPCPASKFWLTIDWSSQTPSTVTFNGNTILTYAGGSPPAQPIHLVLDVTSLMASPNDNILSATLGANTAFHTTYSLVGSACDCTPRCSDGTPIADQPVIWQRDLSTGNKQHYVPTPSTFGQGSVDDDWRVGLAPPYQTTIPVLPDATVVSNYPAAWVNMQPAQWITARQPVFGNPPGIASPLPPGTYWYVNDLDLLFTPPSPSIELKLLLEGRLAGDDNAQMQFNGHAIPGSTIGAYNFPANIQQDVTTYFAPEAVNELAVKVVNGGSPASGAIFYGNLSAHVCSCTLKDHGNGDDYHAGGPRSGTETPPNPDRPPVTTAATVTTQMPSGTGSQVPMLGLTALLGILVGASLVWRRRAP